MAYIRVDVVYVLLHDSQADTVLLVENLASWSLPGGKREYGETLQQAAIREAQEETGFDVAVAGVAHLSEKFIGDEHVVFVTFLGTIIGGHAETTDANIKQISWKSFRQAEQLMPYHNDIRALLTTSIPYTVESAATNSASVPHIIVTNASAAIL